VWPYPELDGVACGGHVVGPDGTRIVDEGLGGISIANALAKMPDPACATLICDAAIWEGPAAPRAFPPIRYLERYGGPLLRADTLAQLAAAAGLPAAALTETVTGYNAALAADTLAQLSPRRSPGYKPWPITQAPFIAIPLCVAITNTMGGHRRRRPTSACCATTGTRDRRNSTRRRDDRRVAKARGIEGASVYVAGSSARWFGLRAAKCGADRDACPVGIRGAT
jgi:hypothetical protein